MCIMNKIHVIGCAPDIAVQTQYSNKIKFNKDISNEYLDSNVKFAVTNLFYIVKNYTFIQIKLNFLNFKFRN